MENETQPEKFEEKTAKNDEVFKKPTILIGKVGKLPKKTVTSKTTTQEPTEEPKTEIIDEKPLEKKILGPENIQKTTQNVKTAELSYTEPEWSGIPTAFKDYELEVLKSGVILETINLMSKKFWVFGRLPTCDIPMAHPTISRYHAVVQYKSEPSQDMPVGFYIYDLGSTHGTFLNKLRIKPNLYVRVQVGHMLKLGCSTRTFLLNGPEDDTEDESELSVTELKKLREEELKQREEKQKQEAEKREQERLKREKDEETRGIDWGMGEDADEDSDLTVNPYAETNNEDLYIDDPKKALRNFFEREGLELNYDCTERGLGQFCCTVELPLDDPRGRPIVAEVLHKGKKKEAVIQCALEACRILDRHGVLRQAAQESKKRKAKNWEENDYYDSDEDTFLDRTGTIEKKREKRMKANQPQQPETYQSLCTKEKNINERIKELEQELDEINRSKMDKKTDETETDSLDTYMKELNENKPDKYQIGKLKNELTQLRKDHGETVKLVNLTRPADLPPLVIESTVSIAGSSTKPGAKSLPIFGKRLKVKVTVPSRETPKVSDVNSDEENDSDCEETVRNDNESNDIENGSKTEVSNEDLAEASTSQQNVTEPSTSEDQETRKGILERLEMNILKCDKTALQSLDSKLKAKISKTVVKLRKIAEEEESIIVDEKRLAVQKKKIIEQVTRPMEDKNIEIQMKQLNRITNEFCTISDKKIKMVNKINKLAEDINQIAIEIRKSIMMHQEETVNRMQVFVNKSYNKQVEVYNELLKLEQSTKDKRIIDKLKILHDWLSDRKTKMINNLEKLKDSKNTVNTNLIEEIIEYEEESDDFITTILEEIHTIQKEQAKELEEETSNKRELEDDSESSDKKKKKNIRRIQQRQEKAEMEKQKQYEEDAKKEDYNMWLPPDNQTGDGRTSLNEKYGY